MLDSLCERSFEAILALRREPVCADQGRLATGEVSRLDAKGRRIDRDLLARAEPLQLHRGS